jgi:hypothetical protein
MPLPDLDPIHPIDMVVAAEMFAPLQRFIHARPAGAAERTGGIRV